MKVGVGGEDGCGKDSVDSKEVEHAVRMIMWVGLWREEMRSLIE